MGLNIDALQANWNRKNSKTWGLDDGENIIRLLPRSAAYFSPTGDNGFAFEFYTHYKVSESAPVVTCPTTFGQKCPICEVVKKLRNSESPEDKQLVNDIKRATRYYYNVLNYSNLESGVIVLETGPMVYKQLIKFILRKEWGDFLSVQTGRNLIVTKTPPQHANDWMSYNVMPDPNPSNAEQYLLETWKDDVARLETLIEPAKSYEELTALIDPTQAAPPVHYSTPAPAAAPVYQPQPAAAPAVPPQPAAASVVQPEPQPATASVVQPQSQPVAAATAQPEPQASEDVPELDADGIPTCFGVSFSPRGAKCRSCNPELKNKCRQAYLNDGV